MFFPTKGDLNYSSVSVLLSMEGTNNSTTFIDGSASPKTVTPHGNAKISTTQSKWGSGSGYFDGNGDYLSIPSSTELGFGTGDFTMEYWVYHLTGGNIQTVIDTRSGVNMLCVLGKAADNSVRCYDGSTIRTGGSLSLNAWHHVAWCRSGTNNIVYADGVSVITFTSSADGGSSRGLTVCGLYDQGGEWLNGYINDLRFTKGIARYTSNFTPSSNALLAYQGTDRQVSSYFQPVMHQIARVGL